MLRRLELPDMDAAARVHRIAFDRALPTLAGLHTSDEDRWFFRERVFPACALWGAFDGAGMTGMIAFRNDWIDQLYVLPVGAAAGRRIVAFAGRARFLRTAAALDIPAQCQGSALL
jgi:hypothetical protein